MKIPPASQPANSCIFIVGGPKIEGFGEREKKTGVSREGLNFPYPFGNLLLWYGACFRVNVLSCSQNALVCALCVVEFWHLLHVAGWRIWICFGVFTGLKSATPFLCCGQDFVEGVFSVLSWTFLTDTFSDAQSAKLEGHSVLGVGTSFFLNVHYFTIFSGILKLFFIVNKIISIKMTYHRNYSHITFWRTRD